MKFVIAAGATRTAHVDGISAAGATPALLAHTPSADLEIVERGHTVDAPVVPVSPTGCPTPAIVTRAVREHLEFPVLAVDAGLATPTAATTESVGAIPGGDVRDPVSFPEAGVVFENALEIGRSLPDDEIFVGETIPGGTTTALGVLTALGERASVSSSLAENPVEQKRGLVTEGLSASGLDEGTLEGSPIEAVRRMGDPVLATVAGIAAGALEGNVDVTLAGGTQMAAAAALVRHADVDALLPIATTSFVAADETAAIAELAADLDCELVVTDPGFDERSHPALDAYAAGEAKEGVGMGGALALAKESALPMATVRETVVDLTDRLTDRSTDGDHADET